MKEGPLEKVPCTLSNVKTNESLTFSGVAMGGLMQFSGTVEITKKGDKESHINYTFEMAGCLGSFFSFLNPKPIVHGTEAGLANMVKLSEEKESSS